MVAQKEAACDNKRIKGIDSVIPQMTTQILGSGVFVMPEGDACSSFSPHSLIGLDIVDIGSQGIMKRRVGTMSTRNI